MYDRLKDEVHDILGNNEMSGRKLRMELMKRIGYMSVTVFYREMAKLEEQQMLQGSYTKVIVEGYEISQRRYRR